MALLVSMYLQGTNNTQRNISNLPLYCFGSSQKGNQWLGRECPPYLFRVFLWPGRNSAVQLGVPA